MAYEELKKYRSKYFNQPLNQKLVSYFVSNKWLDKNDDEYVHDNDVYILHTTTTAWSRSGRQPQEISKSLCQPSVKLSHWCGMFQCLSSVSQYMLFSVWLSHHVHVLVPKASLSACSALDGDSNGQLVIVYLKQLPYCIMTSHQNKSIVCMLRIMVARGDTASLN